MREPISDAMKNLRNAVNLVRAAFNVVAERLRRVYREIAPIIKQVVNMKHRGITHVGRPSPIDDKYILRHVHISDLPIRKTPHQYRRGA